MSIKWTLDHSFALDRLMLYKLYLIGGSYITRKEEANDIDVCVHEYHAGCLADNWKKNGFYRLAKGDKKYDEIDSVRLTAIYEGSIHGTNVNIIVVGACFWPAYVGSINEMAANPELYQTRDQRVELHRRLSRQIAKIAGIELIGNG